MSFPIHGGAICSTPLATRLVFPRGPSRPAPANANKCAASPSSSSSRVLDSGHRHRRRTALHVRGPCVRITSAGITRHVLTSISLSPKPLRWRPRAGAVVAAAAAGAVGWGQTATETVEPVLYSFEKSGGHDDPGAATSVEAENGHETTAREQAGAAENGSEMAEGEGEGERERRELRASLGLWNAVMLVARRRWPKVLLAAVALVSASTVVLAAPLFSSGVIECLIGARPESAFPRILGGLVGIYTLEPLFTFLYVRSVCSLGEEVVASLRRDLFRALLVQRVEFFDQNRAGELAALLSVEIGTVRQLVTANVSRDRGFRAFSECVGSLVVLFCIAPKLAPILATAIILFSLTTAAFNRRTGKLFAADAQAQGAVSASAAITLGAIRTVRSFGGEALSFKRFGEEAAAAEHSGINLSKARAKLECVNRGCIYASLLLLYAVGGWLVKSGQVTVGSLIACIGYAFGLIFATQGVVNTAADAKAAVAALGRARDLVTSVTPDPALADIIPLDGSEASEWESMSAAGKAVSSHQHTEAAVMARERRATDAAAGSAFARATAASGDIVLHDVHFAFPSRPEADVLTGVNLTLPQGQVTALVGSSGAGKSTITQLLCRFYDPSKGAITVGGTDMSSLNRVNWLDAVALVGQEPVLFAGSVADNIRYGRAGATAGAAHSPPPTDEEVEAAARAANAHVFITELTEGYNTEVGDGGGRLSGGQRQRIAIARAILKDAPVLILDEATSALDAISEAAVQSALERLMKGRTTLVIAHRLSTVQRADQIAVMERGQLVECGSHNELLRLPDGVYNGLVNSQRFASWDPADA